MSNARKLADNLPSVGQLSGRNVIVNGGMAIAQRGTSFSTGSSTVYTLDRFQSATGSSFNFDLTLTQSTDTPTGFSNSLKVSPDSTQTPSGSHNGAIRYNIEAQDLQRFAYGSSSAKKITLSFYVKSNKTGTYSVQLIGYDGQNSCVASYTIDASNTWERKTITIDPDTSNAFANDNTIGILIAWHLACGPDDIVSPNTSWGVATTGFRAATGQVNFMDATANEWYLTGVQLEVGSQASPFEHEPVGVTLRKCQRYYSQINGPVHGYAMWSYSTVCSTHFYLPEEMRTIPSVTFTGTTNQNNSNAVANDNFSIYNHNSWIGASGTGVQFGGTNSPNHKTIRVNCYPHGSFTSNGISCGFYMGTNCSINADAEL